jgi:hypothetical protein
MTLKEKLLIAVNIIALLAGLILLGWMFTH